MTEGEAPHAQGGCCQNPAVNTEVLASGSLAGPGILVNDTVTQKWPQNGSTQGGIPPHACIENVRSNLVVTVTQMRVTLALS